MKYIKYFHESTFYHNFGGDDPYEITKTTRDDRHEYKYCDGILYELSGNDNKIDINSIESVVSTKDLLNKELYLTPEDIDNLKSEESNYEANESEKIILKEVQNTTETFINSTEDKNKATEIGLNDNITKIEDALLTKIKNCP